MVAWSDIAVEMARLVAAQRGCELQSFRLDEVEFEDGVVRVRAHGAMSLLPDEIPFDDPEIPVVAEA